MRESRFTSLSLKGIAIAIVIGTLSVCVVPSMAAQPGNASGKYLNVENGKIYYEECGTGDEAVVLLHDGVVHSAVWNDVWPTLCKQYHTIRYDRRGYGRSPEATSWYTETDDLFALLRNLKVRHAILVGSEQALHRFAETEVRTTQLIHGDRGPCGPPPAVYAIAVQPTCPT